MFSAVGRFLSIPLKVSARSGGYPRILVRAPVPRLRPYAAAAFSAIALLAVGPVGACPLELVGTPSREWEQAADQTRAAFGGASTPHCASVTVEVLPVGAVVRLAAPDGRLAVRELHEPAELLPVMQALTVEGPAAKPEPAVEPAAPAAEPDQGASGPFHRNHYETRPLIGASVGFRLGADRLITPTVGGTISILSQRLEVGLLARYEAHYVASNGGNDGRPETSGFALGALVGWHHELDRIALRAGALGLVAALREEGSGQQGRAEARLGGYLGGVWPARGKLRLRSDLSLELVPYNLGRSETNALGATSFPWWACGFSIGVELG